MQENEEENVKVKLQNPHQAASISILERISDSGLQREGVLQNNDKKSIIVWQSRAEVDSLGNFLVL